MTQVRALVLVLIAAAALFGVHALRGPSEKDLLGLWEVGTPSTIGDPLRFYYFHTGGKGLYRYGVVGYNQTRSFDWSVSGDALTLRFRKTGETARTRFTVETRDGQRVLVLKDDPRNEGEQRYRRRPADVGETDAEAMDVDGPLGLERASDSSSGMERMWIDRQKFATGGEGFSIYQLSKHTLPNSDLLGWYHAGDFDDWTTETLAYRLQPGALSLWFLWRGARSSTSIRVDGTGRARTLTLGTDPRDFYARHRYADAGPSF